MLIYALLLILLMKKGYIKTDTIWVGEYNYYYIYIVYVYTFIDIFLYKNILLYMLI